MIANTPRATAHCSQDQRSRTSRASNSVGVGLGRATPDLRRSCMGEGLASIPGVKRTSRDINSPVERGVLEASAAFCMSGSVLL